MFSVRVTSGLRRSGASGAPSSRELDRAASAPREVAPVSGQLGVAEQRDPVGETVRADSAGAGSAEAEMGRRGAGTLEAAGGEGGGVGRGAGEGAGSGARSGPGPRERGGARPPRSRDPRAQ